LNKENIVREPRFMKQHRMKQTAAQMSFRDYFL